MFARIKQDDDNVKKDETLSGISKDENEEKYGISNTFTRKNKQIKSRWQKKKK